MNSNNAICGYCKESLENTVSRSINEALEFTKTSTAQQNITHLNCNHQFHVPCIQLVAEQIDKLPSFDPNNSDEFKQKRRSICKLCPFNEKRSLPQVPPKDKNTQVPPQLPPRDKNTQVPTNQPQGRPTPPPGHQNMIPQRKLPSQPQHVTTPQRISHSSFAFDTKNNPPILQPQQSNSSSLSALTTPSSKKPFSYMSQVQITPNKGSQSLVQQTSLQVQQSIPVVDFPEGTVPNALPLPSDLSTPKTPLVPPVKTQPHSFQTSTTQDVSNSSSTINAIGRSVLGIGMGTAVAGIIETVTENVIESIPKTLLKGTGIAFSLEIANFAYRNIFHRPHTMEEFLHNERPTAIKVATYVITGTILALL